MKKLLLAVTVFMVFVSLANVQAENWPSVQLDYNNSGFLTNNSVFDGELFWRTQLGNDNQYMGVTVYNGVVYGNADGTKGIIGLNATTGSVVMNFTVDGSKPYGYAIDENGILYATEYGLTNNKLYAIYTNNYSSAWNLTMTSANNQMTNGITTKDDMVYVLGVADWGEVMAVNTTTRTTKWNVSLSGLGSAHDPGLWINGSDTIDNTVIFASDRDWKVYAINASSGSIKYQIVMGSDDVEPTVTVLYGLYGDSPQGDICTSGDWDGHVFAFYCINGTNIWNATVISPEVIGSFATSWNDNKMDDSIYVPYEEGRLRKLDGATGTELCMFSLPAGYNIRHSPALSEHLVYFGADDDHTFYAVHTANCTQAWNYTADDRFYFASPALADGVVYVGNLDGYIYAFNGTLVEGPDLKKPNITIQSPQPIVYNSTLTIALNVAADETITVWNYSLNGGSNVTFTPNSSIQAIIGSNILNVFASDASGNIGKASVEFIVEGNVTVAVYDEFTLEPFNGTIANEIILDLLCQNTTRSNNITGFDFSTTNVSIQIPSFCGEALFRLKMNFTDQIYFRTLIQENAANASENLTFYMADPTEKNVITIAYKLSDPSGDYLGSIFELRKIQENNLITIVEQRFDATDRVFISWVEGEAYLIRLIGDGVPIRDLGQVIVSTDTQQIITLSQLPVFSGTNLTVGDFYYTVEPDQSAQTIQLVYLDLLNLTTSVKFEVSNASNFSQVLYSTTSTGSSANSVVSTYNNVDTNFSYVVKVIYNRDGNTNTFTSVVGFSNLLVDFGVDSSVLGYGALFAVLVIGGMFGALHSRTGAILLAILTAGIWQWGFLTGLPAATAGIIIAILIISAIIAKTGQRRSD